MKLISIYLISLLSLNCFAKDTTKAEQAKVMSQLVGEYVNKRGDSASATFAYEKEEQPSLFGPEEFNFQVEISAQNQEVWISDGDFSRVDEDGSVLFDYAHDDCDDPGCTNYEGTVTFKKKKNGGYYLIVKVNFSSDATESMAEWIASNNEDHDLVEELYDDNDYIDAHVEQMCKDYYHPEAYGYNNNGWVRCEYSVESYLALKNN